MASDKEQWRAWLERIGEKIVGTPSIDEAFQYQADVTGDDQLHALSLAIAAAIFELEQDSIDADLLVVELGGCLELDAVLRVRARIDAVSTNLLNLLLNVKLRMGENPVNY